MVPFRPATGVELGTSLPSPADGPRRRDIDWLPRPPATASWRPGRNDIAIAPKRQSAHLVFAAGNGPKKRRAEIKQDAQNRPRDVPLRDTTLELLSLVAESNRT